MWFILILIIVCFCNTLQVNSQTYSQACEGAYSTKACKNPPCPEYTASWVVRKDKTVDFTVKNTGLQPNSWVGIGFSTTGGMIGSDIVMYNPSTGKVTDKYVNEDRAVLDDRHPDLLSSSVKRTGNTVEMKFTRKLDTGDHAQDVSLDQCVKFLFPYSPGEVESYGHLSEHKEIPTSSDECLNKCFN